MGCVSSLLVARGEGLDTGGQGDGGRDEERVRTGQSISELLVVVCRWVAAEAEDEELETVSSIRGSSFVWRTARSFSVVQPNFWNSSVVSRSW